MLSTNQMCNKVLYQKKKLRDQVGFLFADQQNFLQVGAIAFGRCDQACPKYPKY